MSSRYSPNTLQPNLRRQNVTDNCIDLSPEGERAKLHGAESRHLPSERVVLVVQRGAKARAVLKVLPFPRQRPQGTRISEGYNAQGHPEVRYHHYDLRDG